MSNLPTPAELNEQRLKLRSNGYRPVPVLGAHVDQPGAGKAPKLPAWQTVCLTADAAEITGWSKSRRLDTNSGILCGELRGVDIDVLDEELSAKLVARAVELFGPTSLRRIGKAPKTLLVYRVEASSPKLQTPALLFGNNPDTKVDTDKCRVEILGEGNHFVAFGIHPDTRQPYAWPEQSPLDVPFAGVPVVKLEVLQQFLAEAEAVLRAAGGRTAREIKDSAKDSAKDAEKKVKQREGAVKDQEAHGNKVAGLRSKEKPSRAKIADALDHIVNADLDYREWINIGFAIYDGLGDSGRDLWEKFSATYPNHNAKDTSVKWPSFAKGHSVKAATIFWHASQNGWWWNNEGDTETKINLCDFHAYLPDHKYIFIPTRDLWAGVAVEAVVPSVPLFNSDGSPRMADGIPVRMLATTWLDRNQSVEQMTWSPGEGMLIRDRLISEGGWFDRSGATCFNRYRPPTIALGDPTKAGRWVQHVKKIYPENWDHIIKWLAHHVQFPEIKVNHNIVLGGKPGVGKDTILAPARQAVGPWNCSEVSPENLFEDFNPHVQAVLMRVSEARDIGEVSKFQLYEKTKTLGAAPPETLRVNQKYMPAYELANVVGVIITTNYKTDGIYLPADDRRHHVSWSDVQHSDFDSEPGAGDASKYFDAMYHWYEKEGGYSDIAAYLATLDLSAFNPKAPPVKTPAFWAIVNANRPAEESEILDILDRLGNPPAIILDWLISEAAEGDDSSGLFEFLRDRKNRRAIPHRLEAAGYEQVDNPDNKSGLWVVNTVGAAKARKTVYARKTLPVPEQIKSAKCVAEGAVWNKPSNRWFLAGSRWHLQVV